MGTNIAFKIQIHQAMNLPDRFEKVSASVGYAQYMLSLTKSTIDNVVIINNLYITGSE